MSSIEGQTQVQEVKESGIKHYDLMVRIEVGTVVLEPNGWVRTGDEPKEGEVVDTATMLVFTATPQDKEEELFVKIPLSPFFKTMSAENALQAFTMSTQAGLHSLNAKLRSLRGKND